jgi:hypothetical protein
LLLQTSSPGRPPLTCFSVTVWPQRERWAGLLACMCRFDDLWNAPSRYDGSTRVKFTTKVLAVRGNVSVPAAPCRCPCCAAALTPQLRGVVGAQGPCRNG